MTSSLDLHPAKKVNFLFSFSFEYRLALFFLFLLALSAVCSLLVSQNFSLFFHR